MTMMGSFLFKQKARLALRGNWQTALLVTFFAGALLTVTQVLQSVALVDVRGALSSLSLALNTFVGGESLTLTQQGQLLNLYNRVFDAVESVPAGMWTALLVVNVLAVLFTPALSVSCNRYFIRLNAGEELGVREGLLGRLPIWRRALWLYVQMYVRVMLWSLLLVVPGILAALRYSMAPYYLAEDPSLTAKQAIEKSKSAMAGKKMSYFMLRVSFIWYSLLLSMAQALLTQLFGVVISLVAAQFLSLALNVYINGSCAAFYSAVSSDDGMDALLRDMHSRLRQMGVSETDLRRMEGSEDDGDLDNDSDNDGTGGGMDE